MGVSKKDLDSLAMAHTMAFLFHLGNFIGTLVLSIKKFVTYSQPAYKLLVPVMNITDSNQRDQRSLLYYIEPYGQGIELPWLVVGFFCVTFIFHFIYATGIFGAKFYMKNGKQPYRWLEFSLSAGLMVHIQDLLTGIIIDADLFMQLILLITTMIFGYLGEYTLSKTACCQDEEIESLLTSKKGKKARTSDLPQSNNQTKDWIEMTNLITWFGCVPFLGLWISLFWYFFRILVHTDWPSKLYWIPLLVIGEFIAWCAFVFPPLYRTRKMNQGQSYYESFHNYEIQFIILSFVAKTYLGWVLFLAA